MAVRRFHYRHFLRIELLNISKALFISSGDKFLLFSSSFLAINFYKFNSFIIYHVYINLDLESEINLPSKFFNL